MQNKKIAVTGGIGSGKSALCAILREKGYPVFSCDEIYAELCGDCDYLSVLGSRFPECIVEGKLDRKKLSQKIFSDPAARDALNALSHPRIMQRLFDRMEKFPVSFAEVPLLYEGGYEGMFDGVIALRRSRERRKDAVRRRDGLSDEQIEARIASQLDERELAKKNCFLIENDGSLTELRTKAEKALQSFGIEF